MTLVLDTHAVLWYLANSSALSTKARDMIEEAVDRGDDVYVPGISLVEIIYLEERARVPPEAFRRLRATLADPNSGLTIAPLDESVAEALRKIPRQAVPDMPDRIIAATAARFNAPLVSRDRRMADSGVELIW